MAKLHELLAVESDLENTAKKIIQETIKVFKEKGSFFSKQTKETRMFDENAKKPSRGKAGDDNHGAGSIGLYP